MTISLFEAIEITAQALAKNLNEFLDSYGLRKKIIAYIKYEGANLNSMTLIVKFVVNCEILGLEESFNGTCFDHAFSKTCHYVTIKEKVCKDLRIVSIKFVQSEIWKGKIRVDESLY